MDYFYLNMELHNLKPAEGSTKKEKRIGRGQGSGHGGTSTRGHKGAKSRSGYKSKRSFQGGQMPLQRTVPKFGFKNVNRVEYKGVNLSSLQLLAEEHSLTVIDFQSLQDAGFAGNTGHISFRKSQFNTNSCRQTKTHSSQATRINPAPGLIEMIILRGIHLMLADVGTDNGFSLGYFITGVNNLLGGKAVVFAVFKWKCFFIIF